MVHWLMSLRHLSGKVSLAAMLFRGIEAMRPENFTPEGQALQKRFLYSFVGFIGTVFLGAIVGAVAAGR